jgi:lysozyme family protein
MTTTGFTRAMPRVLQHEGGKVDDPADPGGRTNQGVTQAVYTAYRARIGATSKDVWEMRPEERDAIYRKQYWDAISADDLPAGLDYVVFDGAVNSGVSRSSKWLQEALGVEPDGHVGAVTLAAAQAADAAELVDRICDIRMAFLKGLKHWPRFGRGWTARVSGVRTVGKAWANKQAVSVAPAKPTPKATKPQPPEVPGLLASILASLFGRKA